MQLSIVKKRLAKQQSGTRPLRFLLLVGALFLVALLVSCGEQHSEPEQRLDAYVLSVGGTRLSVVASEEEAAEVKEGLCTMKEELLRQKGISALSVRLESEIAITPAVCTASEIQSPEEAVRSIRNSGVPLRFTATEEKTVPLAYKTVYQNSSQYYEGTSKVKQEGKGGESLLTYTVHYTDGDEQERELLSETVVTPAQDRVVLVGTKKSTASTGKYKKPLASTYVTSPFGWRTLNGQREYHYGVDYRAAVGTSVYAADGGKVIYAAYNGSYGYLIKIQHDNGDVSYYAHLSKFSVSVGTRVYQGQTIAKSGRSGNVTGPHLHFEIRKNGSPVNPVPLLSA